MVQDNSECLDYYPLKTFLFYYTKRNFQLNHTEKNVFVQLSVSVNKYHNLPETFM